MVNVCSCDVTTLTHFGRVLVSRKWGRLTTDEMAMASSTIKNKTTAFDDDLMAAALTL
jgi:hypothetical protein